jgi:hypothetical protein
MVKRIVSHVAPRHFDDFLAISILKSKYFDAEVQFIHPQSVQMEYIYDPAVCLVDVGGKYEPMFKNYDHHQRLSLKSSFLLVLINEFENKSLIKKIAEKEAVKFIDLSDRFGVKKASELTGVALNLEEDRMRKEILLVDITKYGEAIGRIALELLLVYGNYSKWIRNFYKHLDEKNLLDEPRAILAQEEALYQEKLKKAQIIQRNDLKILVSYESFAPNHFRLFNETGADLLIERNSMNKEHTSIIKNTSSPKTKEIDLAKVFSIYEKIFLHSNGFIAVVNSSIEQIDIEKVLDVLLAK